MKMTAKPLFALAALAMFASATVAYAQSGGSGAMTKQDAPAAAAPAAAVPAAGSGSMTNSAATDAPKMPAGATTSAGSGAMNATTETTGAGSGAMTNATVKKDGAMEQTMSKDAMPKPAAAPRGSN